jgi:hypothetical protein
VDVSALGHGSIFDLRLPIYDLKNQIAKRWKIEHGFWSERKKIDAALLKLSASGGFT